MTTAKKNYDELLHDDDGYDDYCQELATDNIVAPKGSLQDVAPNATVNDNSKQTSTITKSQEKKSTDNSDKNRVHKKRQRSTADNTTVSSLSSTTTTTTKKSSKKSTTNKRKKISHEQSVHKNTATTLVIDTRKECDKEIIKCVPVDKRGYDHEYIVRNYATKEENGILRILAPQREDDFHKLRAGAHGLSCGGSSMGAITGVSKYRTSLSVFLSKIFPDEYPEPELDERGLYCTRLGSKYEKVIRNVFEQLSKRVCYNGCFFKKKFHYSTLPPPSSSSSSSINNDQNPTTCSFSLPESSYEFVHVCPDGILLKNQIPPEDQISLEEVLQSRSSDTENIRKLSSKMLSIDEIDGVCEFKLSVYNIPRYIPSDHIIQCCFQSMLIGKPCHYVNCHIKDGKIDYIVYAIITPVDELKLWISQRLEIFISHLISRIPLPEDYQEYDRDMVDRCYIESINIIANGAPRKLCISPIIDMNLPEEAPFF